MSLSLKKYLADIKPTKKGVACILVMALFIPLLADMFFFAGTKTFKNAFFLTTFSVFGYIKIIFLTLVYHVVYFIIKRIFSDRW